MAAFLLAAQGGSVENLRMTARSAIGAEEVFFRSRVRALRELVLARTEHSGRTPVRPVPGGELVAPKQAFDHVGSADVTVRSSQECSRSTPTKAIDRAGFGICCFRRRCGRPLLRFAARDPPDRRR